MPARERKLFPEPRTRLSEKGVATTIAIVGLVTFSLWFVSIPLTGEAEPWDASPVLYAMVLLAAGVGGAMAGGLPAAESAFFSWLGAWIGHVAAIALLPWLREWWLLGIFVSGFMSGIAMGGAVIGWGIGWGLSRLRTNR